MLHCIVLNVVAIYCCAQKEGDSGEVPMWELRVEGRLFEETQQGITRPDVSKHVKRKFSSFFKSLVIELDKDIYGPDNHLVEVRLLQLTTATIVLIN